jgi:hypothetical protein
MVNPHHRQAETSNLLMHDDVRVMKIVRSIGSAVNQWCCPGGVDMDLPEGDVVESSRRL